MSRSSSTSSSQSSDIVGGEEKGEKQEEEGEEIKTNSRPEPIDWEPQDKCYFCVDGKLLKVNEIGELVVEQVPVQPETELNKHVS